MINFPCKCGYAFSLPSDQAGGVIQCPQCSLLADVPTLNDLPNINPDGTFAFDESNSAVDPTTAADLYRAFSNKTVDSRGVEKDLRPGPERFAAIGLEEHIKPRPAPRYDPVTGELIRPLQVKDEMPTPVLSIGELVDPSEIKTEDLEEPLSSVSPVAPLRVIALPAVTAPQASLPIPKPRSLGYATGDIRKQVTLKSLWLELLMPANMAVMFFVFLMYVLGYLATSTIATYSERFLTTVWPFLLVNLPMWLIISHIGCVIEQTGPDAIDELPRPLRDLSPGDDFLTPLLRTLLAGVICFWPVVVSIWNLNWANPAALPVVLMLFLAGAFFLPAVLLTTVTGTTYLNLRPDRVLAVIRLCGGNYLFSIALFVQAIVPSVYYIAGDLLFRQQLHGAFFQRIDAPVIILPVMMIAVYLLHFFCWHLGLMYRQNHGQFPWLLQRHVKRTEAKTP